MADLAKNQVLGLFPTPVMRAPALVEAPLRARLAAKGRAGAETRNVHDRKLAHSSMIRPEDDPDFATLAEALAPHLAEYGALLLGETLRWTVKEMWVNVLQSGGHQAMHNHANSFVSVVIYLTPTDHAARTVFHRPLGGGDFAFVNENARTRHTPFNARRWAAPAMEAGDALFFPSYLLHEVPTNQGGERMTIALNCLPERIDSWGYAVRFA
jgi:uncharacterized protein (TIGR02466 family)